MAINYCLHCGTKLEDDTLVCSSCGEPVPHALVYEDGTTELARVDEEEGEADAQASGGGQASEGDRTTGDGQDSEGDRAVSDDQNSEDGQPAGDAEQASDADGPKDGEGGEEDFQQFADLSGFDIIGTYPTYVPPRRRGASPENAEPPLVHEVQEPPAPASPQPKKRGGRAVAAVAGVAALLLLAAGVGLLVNHDFQEALRQRLTPDSAQEAGQEASGGAVAVNDAHRSTQQEPLGEVSDAAATVDEDAAFDALVTVYDKLQSYNDRVYSCLQTYNGVITVADRGQREAAAGIARSLLAEIGKDMDSLEALGIGPGSSLYDDYQNVLRLLGDQYQRLAVVVESWDISLTYSDPYDHQDEIIEPLRRDISADGTNIYLDDFDANYWDSRPTR